MNTATPDRPQGTLCPLAAPPRPAVPRGPARKIAMALALVPPAAVLLWLESRFWRLWRLRFPRSNAEMAGQPSRLVGLLTEPSRGLIAALPVPSGSRYESQRRMEGLAHEPDKDQTTAKWELTFRSGAETHRVRVVTKLQSGRGAPLLMQALRAVFESDFLREVAFYRHLADRVPVRVARPYFADAAPAINRACLVLEAIEGTTCSDAQGCGLDKVRLVLQAAAALNAAYAGRLDDPHVAWIPARSGLAFADWIELFLGRESKPITQLWASLRGYFAGRPTVLAHGDCRPGNMIFTPDGVVMSDWEAVNIAPVLWDFTYCTTLGLAVPDRRAHLDELLQDYLNALHQHGGPAADVKTARVEVDLLAMVLAFVSFCVLERKLWAQGNSQADILAWLDRVRSAVLAIDADRAATQISAPVAVVQEFQASMGRRLVLSAANQ